MNLYQEKDALKENFLTTGKFSSAGKFPVYKSIKLEHRIPVLVRTEDIEKLLSFVVRYLHTSKK